MPLAISDVRRIDRAPIVGSFVLHTCEGQLRAVLVHREGRRAVIFPPGRPGSFPRAEMQAADVGPEFERIVLSLVESSLGQP
jgi:hypothetical protein